MQVPLAWKLTFGVAEVQHYQFDSGLDPFGMEFLHICNAPKTTQPGRIGRRGV